MLRRKWKHRKKDIFYTKYEIFPKIKLQLANADTVFGRRHVCIIIKKRNWNKLNPELWKTWILPQTLFQSHRVLNRKFLQPVIDFWMFVYATEKKKLISAFNFGLLHIKVSSPCENRWLTAPLSSSAKNKTAWRTHDMVHPHDGSGDESS